MISCHCRIIPSLWLLRTAMRMGIWSCTIVASSCIVIWKPPSPVMGQVSWPGAPSAAPRGAAPPAPPPGPVPGARLAPPPPRAQLGPPLVPAGGLREAPQECREEVARVGHDAEVGVHVLADLGAIDVDVDDSGVRREGARLAGDAVVEAAADAHEQVAVLDRLVDVHPAVHPGVAQRQRVALVDVADAAERGGHRG